MNLSEDPWQLPSARAFLSEIESQVAGGGCAAVKGGPSMPAGLDLALQQYLEANGISVTIITPQAAGLPLEAVAMPFGVPAELETLAQGGLSDHLAVIVGTGLGSAPCAAWRIFLNRFRAVRSKGASGLSVLFLAPDGFESDGVPCLGWNGRLRRVDVTIWADFHAPLDRPEPLAALAAALAVELCGWRLDLAADIARAGREDLLNPFGWLALRSGVGASPPCTLGGLRMSCPIALLDQGAESEIRNRIWLAQLTALFPWIETHRQKVIGRHRKLLRVNDQLRAFGVTSVDEIEFGALAWQLNSRIARMEAEMITCFAQMRNDLAHRKPVNPSDLDRTLRGAVQLDKA